MQRIKLIGLSVMLLLTGAGCANSASDSGPDTLRPTVRDSAGVRLYEHPVEVFAAMPRLGVDTTTPLATFGGADPGEVDVSSIPTMALLRDGSMAGFHRREGALVIFSAEGSEIGRFGGQQDGQRVFGLIAAVAGIGKDTLVITDLMNARFQVAHPDSGLLRAFTGVFRDGAEFHSVAGRFPDGTWLLRPGYLTGGGPVPAEAELPSKRSSMAIGRIRHNVVPTGFDTLMLVPGWEMVRAQIPVNGQMVWADLHPHYGARSHAVMWGAEAAIITNEDWSVSRYDAEGRLTSSIRINAPQATVTDSIRRRLIEGFRRAAATEWAGHVDSARRVSGVDSVVAAMVMADSIAPYDRMQLAPGQRLWIQETAIAPSDPTTLIGFEPDGRIVGRLEVPLPPGGHVAAVGDDRVVVRVTVPNRQSYFTVWRIREL